MVKKTLIVTNAAGLHARPASYFVKEASMHACNVTLCKGEKSYNAKSILSVLSACVKSGTEIEILCDGSGEAEALIGIVAAVESGLGE